MKRGFSILLAAALALSLAGCTSPAANTPTPAVTAPATQLPSQSAAPAETPAQEVTWEYALTTETVSDEYANEEGVVLATVSYTYPVLTAVSSTKAGQKAPNSVQRVVDRFNLGIQDYVDSLYTAEELGQQAREQYEGTDPEYRSYWSPYYCWTESGDTFRQGDFLEARVFRTTYWGGAHGAEEIRNFHYDLGTGTFVELTDLTDDWPGLHDLIAEDVIDGIFARGEENWYNDGFSQTIRDRESYNVSFGEEGVSVIFDEYEIGAYAMGMPEFPVSYAKLSRFLNPRGQALLDLPLETRTLGDYYDATEMWYWFEGSVPLDYSDARDGVVTNENGSYEMPFLRVDLPGVSTMAQLRARLATRFSEELVEGRITGSGLFTEFDGVLYAAAAGRGTDWTVESVDYTVELNADQTAGRILADIHRQDYDWETDVMSSTGEIDQVEFPFVLGENGAVFTSFPTIW